MEKYEPVYIETARKGLLAEKVKKAREGLRHCRLCPRSCGVDRLSGETGICGTGESAVISSFNAHFGEEAPLVGSHGSGTIFFTHCNLLCIFCQNFDISHEGHGQDVTAEQLSDIMIHLQNSGCHNINFVTPTHVVPQILESVEIAVQKGLSVPLVYNSSGYDNVETLRILDGVIDIYMPDFKFWDSGVAEETCSAKDYPAVAKNALREMHSQVGDLVIDASGIARKGLLVRHLVMPEGMAGTRQVMRFIAREISDNTYVNIMPQYRPCGRASEISSLNHRPTRQTFAEADRAAMEEGIKRLDARRRVFRIF